MRELALQTQLLQLDEEPFKTLEGNDAVDLTVGRAVLEQLGRAVSESKDALFTTFSLGLALRKSVKTGQESILLETVEYDHLKTVVEGNPFKFIDIIQAQLRRAIEAAPEVAVKKQSAEE